MHATTSVDTFAMMHIMQILILIAGTNDPSNSATLAKAFRDGIDELKGIKTEVLYLKDLEIEQFSLKHYDENFSYESDFIELQDLVQNSDGIVIATPVWNFGSPAHLKNFIDRMGSFALDETRSKGTLNGKPFYLIFTGGAPAPAWTGLMKKTTSYIPEAIKYFGGSILGTHFEPRCTLGKGKFGLVVDKRPESLKKMKDEGLKFALLAKEFKKSGKLPVKQNVLKHFYSLGQRIISHLK